MIISYDWLTQYLDSDLSPEETSLILTDIGLEVDSFEKCESIRGGLEGVVVGHVLTCEKHPDADKLSVTTISTGDGEPIQVVCGAPNVAAGQKVLVATVNTTLYPAGAEEGFKIKRSKIRGVESLGMICAEDELGLGASHDGIMELDQSAVPGTPAREHLGLSDDYTIEIGLTPNRIDAASHFGVARDLAAYLRTHGRRNALSLPPVGDFSAGKAGEGVAVEVRDTVGAPRYSGLTISGVKIGSSPEWLQKRLRAIGMTPHNNVVDITNFVLHETGQPLHAFDAAKIDGRRIVVRTCEQGTKFVTLDGVERQLWSDDLMICSESGPLCIAGIYGGVGSGVSEETTEIFLESAYFNSVRVRKTARRLGINTDASFRYERGADPNMTIYALKRAAMLIVEIAGGRVVSDVTDIYPEKIENFRFDLSLDRLNRLIGKEIPAETVKTILGALDIDIEKETQDVLSVAVPPFRVDVQREADLAEEILRLYGYNNVEIPAHVRSALSYSPRPDTQKMTEMVADSLCSVGFTEIMSNSLTKASYYEGLESYPAANCVKILNPLSSDLGVMRQTLLFNALEAVRLNTNHRNPDLKLYEFGNVYSYDAAKKEEGGLAPYTEISRLAITVTGLDHRASWNVKPHAVDFFFLRGVVEKLLARFGVDIYALKAETIPSDVFDEAIAVQINGKELLRMGAVARKLTGEFDIRNDVFFMEMNFGLLLNATKKHKVAYREISRYPEVRRDLALVVERDVAFAALRETALKAERKLLKSVSLFDVYEGDKVAAGKKSYALGFVFEDATRTLTDGDIDRMMNNLISRFEKEHGAAVRS